MPIFTLVFQLCKIPVKKYHGTSKEEEKLVRSILEDDYDFIVLDVAYTKPEEERIVIVNKVEELYEFTGFKLLHKIRKAKPTIIIFLFSKNPSKVLGIAGNKYDVAGTLAKDQLKEAADLLYSIARNKLICNLEFHDAINENISEEVGSIKEAFKGFFLKTTPAHRFANLCKSLMPILIEMAPDKAVLLDDLWRRLGDTHKLLSLTDKGARDHVKHTGNVFWVGYFLLRNCYREAFSDLFLGWIISSLFHDWAYADQKYNKVEELLMRVYPKAKITNKPLSSSDIQEKLERLKLHVASVETPESKTILALTWIAKNWGKPVPLDYDPDNTKKVNDHGILGAVHLLILAENAIKNEYKNLFLQAVLAIALHNLADWQRCWSKKGIPADIKIPYDKFPLCGLLALSDNIQTWEREHDNPLESIENPDLREIVQSYVRAGEIVEFELEHKRDHCDKYVLTASTQYSISDGKSAKEACGELYNSVIKWKSQGHLKNILEIFELKDKIQIKMKYLMPFKSAIEIDSDA